MNHTLDTHLIISDKEDGKLIRFKVTRNDRTKFLFFIYGSFFLLLALIMLGDALRIEDLEAGSIFRGLFTCSMSIGAGIISYRYFNKATETEEIFVDKEWLILIQRGFFRAKRKAFKLDKISNLHFVENEKYTPHPLGGGSWDQFGLNARQKEVERIHEDGNFTFDYGLHEIKFGKGQGSWVFHELDVFLYEYTGRDLRYAKIAAPELY